MNHNHLSTADIALFRENADSSRSLEIGRHLLTCRDCRSKLPTVTAKELRSCLLESAEVETNDDVRRISFGFAAFPIARVAAYAAIILLLGVGGYFVSVRNSSSGSDITTARNDHDLPTAFQPSIGESDSGANAGKDVPPIRANRTEGLIPVRDHPKARTTKPIVSNRTSTPLRTVETRGSGNPCASGAVINLESESSGKDILLKWNAVKGAKSYEVYVSDLDENLIDHFKSDSQTKYRFTVNLEPERSYRWKLVITLENGSRIVGPPQNLKPGSDAESSANLTKIDKQHGVFRMRCADSK